MVCGVGRTYRRFAAAFALLGLAFYALLIPWHLTSQFSAKLFEAEFGTLASTMCGDGPVDPSAPSSGCPICKGLAAFQLALEPAPAAVVLPRTAELPQLQRLREHVAGASLPIPRSRGPPLIS